LYTQALNPTKVINKKIATEVSPRLVKDIGFSGSLKSLKETAAQYLKEAGDNLSNVEDTLPPDLKVNTGIASQSLRNLAGSYTLAAKGEDLPALQTVPSTPSLDDFGKPIITSTDISDAQPSTIDDVTPHSTAVRNTANTLADQLDKINPSIANVIRQRRILDEGLSGVYKGSDPAANGSVAAQKHGADALRGAIAAASPDMAKVNAEYSFWKKANDVIDQTTTRRKGQSGGLMNLAAVGVGAARAAAGDVTGGIETWAALKAAKGLFLGVPGLTGQAALLNRLATLVGTGDVAGATGLLKREAGAGVAALFSNLYGKYSGEDKSSPNK
jgi:hypothetical protein